jgi:hypothetical protein
VPIAGDNTDPLVAEVMRQFGSAIGARVVEYDNLKIAVLEQN